jgi:hypothetical protein
MELSFAVFGCSTLFYLFHKKWRKVIVALDQKKLETISDLPTNQSSLERVATEEPHLLTPKKNVETTPVDVLGPFYVIGAPFRAKLCPIDASGRKLVIRGTLRNSSGNFVPFTVIDLWQVGFQLFLFSFSFLFLISLFRQIQQMKIMIFISLPLNRKRLSIILVKILLSFVENLVQDLIQIISVFVF